ncbi:uncharacterized protein LOC5503268 isoform X2 [Nematostella vectensis]|uniref:uncharacterized protein LOC5503268 isoform X2 n=1 Tax=Nematostella vectensis TaxID=45351 RepID=UPI0020771906|nr:uncharacterized protein LOC5503268 isoform X2 [Nematostella vectensis]XP_048585925.1 uncharacterized protein LOC5503268 isoform X2 [Nematostella vectensis]XP_048585926.1 uncharacterized protein LOC5503268 isoform X2 [Nematostella vectensis]
MDVGITAEKGLNSLDFGDDLNNTPPSKRSRLNSNLMEATSSNCEATSSSCEVLPENNIFHSSYDRDNVCTSNGETCSPFLFVDVEVEHKKVENVPLAYGCPIRDISKYLARNESIQIVYYLYKKLQRCEKFDCDVSNAQVFVRLSSKWRWTKLDDLIADTSQAVGEAFSDILPYCKLTFSLEPSTEEVQSCAEIENQVLPSAEQLQVIQMLLGLLSQHSQSELIKAHCPLSQAVISRLEKDHTLPEMSNEELETLQKWIHNFNLSKQELPQTTVAIPPQSDSVKPKQGSSKTEHKDGHHEGGYSRYAKFDSNSERPLLRAWYKRDPTPSRELICQYTAELNRGRYRQQLAYPVTERSVYTWFKNARARSGKRKQGLLQTAGQIQVVGMSPDRNSPFKGPDQGRMDPEQSVEQ